MRLLIGTLLFCLGSALIPVMNAEAYLSVVAQSSDWWPALLGFVAGLGQTGGKVVWYYAGRGSTKIPWIRKKLESPKWQGSYDRWYARTSGRPVLATALLAASGFSGFPPLAVMAVLFGALRFNLPIFTLTVLVSRALRFWVILEAAGLAWTFL